MARSSSSSSSTAASSQRSKKPSTSLAEGVTPRGPRRRKQPSSSTASTKGGAGRNNQSNDNNSNNDNDGDYSFLADDNDIVMTDNGNSKQSRVKVKAVVGRDKENEMNHRLQDKRTSRENLVTMQEGTTQTVKTKLPNIDELNDAMARVSIGGSESSGDGNDNKGNSNIRSKKPEKDTTSERMEYTMSACPPVGYGTNKLTISTSTKDQLLCTLQKAIQTLAKQEGHTTTTIQIDPTTYKVLSKNAILLETVVSSSHNLKSTPSIIIEENASKLVDMAKKCLKALTSLADDGNPTSNKTNKKSSSNDKLELALLRIAVHSLRSITPTLDYSESKSMVEIVIKLFYHCVVIAGDACHKKFQSFGNGGSSSSTKKNGNLVGVVLEYALLCLGSYEGLGRLLHNNNGSCNSNAKTKKDGIALWDEILPIPKIGDSIKSDTRAATPLPQKQLSKIALESSQCAASSLLYLSLVAIHSSSATSTEGEEWTVPNEFHFATSVIYETCSGKYDGTPPMFQKVLTNVTLPYILHSLLENIDALRQVKKVYRILWDGARSIEEVGNASNSTTLRICSLDLYREAIIFILDALHQCFELCTNNPSNLSDADQREVNALFDRAASSAMKAAAMFEKSAGMFATTSSRKGKNESSSLVKNKKALLQFHNIVGTKLDLTRKCTSLCGDASPVSASYFEYCTYRSVHLFRLTGKYALSSFTLKDAGKASRSDDDSLMAMWTFFVVDLSLQARHGMGNNNAALTMPGKEIELIITSFEKKIISASATIQSRARSMMLLAELHKEATKILSSTSDQSYAEKGPFLAVMGSILERCMAPLELMLARSQKDASRSMNFRLSSSDIHAKSALFYTIASEVNNVEEKERFSSISDSQLQKSFDILMKVINSVEDNAIEGNDQCILAVEMFAKVRLNLCFLVALMVRSSNTNSLHLYLNLQFPTKIATCIGKRRTSIQAQLFAVEILSKLSIKKASVEMFDKYQIYNRYMMLSSIMETNGHTRESIATMAVALWSVIEEMKILAEMNAVDEEAAVGDTVSEHVLLFPATYASAFESNETATSSILSKLTRTYVDFRESSAGANIVQDNCLPKCLEKTLIGKLLDVASSSCKEGKQDTNRQLNLSKLLHYAIWNQKRYEVLTSAQLAEIVREVLLSIAKITKRCISRDDGFTETASHLIEEAKTFLQAQKKRVGDVTDRDVHQVMSSSFHTYFAAIMMDSKCVEHPRPSMWVQCQGANSSEQLLLKQSYSQLQHADYLFTEDSSNEDSITDACFFAQWAAIQFRQAVLMEHLSLGKISCDLPSNGTRSFIRYNHSATEKYRSSLSTCCRAVEMFDEELFPEVAQSLLNTLQRLLYRFGQLGDTIASTQSFSLLQQVCSLLSQPLRAITSVSGYVLASSMHEHSVPLFLSNTHFRQNIEAISPDEEDDANLDLIRCAGEALNSLLHVFDDKSLQTFQEEPLLELSTFISEQVEKVMLQDADADEAMLVVEMNTILGRLYFLISKRCLAMGKPLTALQFLCSCRQECKTQLKLLRAIGKYHNIPLEGSLERNDDLQAMCYEEMSVAFATMGIRRKAEDHAVLAVLKRRIIHASECQRVSQVNVQDLVDLGCDLDGLDCALQSVRTILQMKFLSSSPDKMALESLELKSSLLPKMESSGAANFHQFVCRSKTLLSCESHTNSPARSCCFDILHSLITCSLFSSAADYDSLQNISSFQSKAQAYLDRAYQGYEDMLQSGDDDVLPLAATHAEIRLRKCRGAEEITSAIPLLKDVVTARNAPEKCCAQAHYELGLIALENARAHGELQTLWHDYLVTNCEARDGEYPPLQYTLEARSHFQRALCQAGPSATKFTKDVLRCLALTTGPEDTDATSFFIHASIGGNSRATVLDIFSEPSEADCSQELQDNVKTLFQMFDDERIDFTQRIQSFQSILNDSASFLLDNWTVSSVAICPTGEIVVSSIRKKVMREGNAIIKTSNVCIMQRDQKHNVHSDLLIPLDQIIDRSQRQLHGMTEEAQTEQYNEESVRRKWWSERHKIDDDLCSLLKFAEAEYFGSDVIKDALISNLAVIEGRQHESPGEDDSSECSDFGPAPARLASRFEQVEIEESDNDSLKKLTVAALKERLKSVGVASAVFQKMRKAELIDLLASELERASEDTIMDSVQETSIDMSSIEHGSSEEPCTILILDEHLQRFPFESMDMFAGKAVTRVPSLPFVFATLMESESLSVDPDRISYVLDPESNLSETASNLGPALNNLASSRGWEWNGVIGEMPTQEFMTQTLQREHGMFLYCGHGGGEKFFSRSQVEEIMTSRNDGVRGCRPPVVLMGCSSGKLQSVNCPKENLTSQVHSIYYEPEGIALSYLIAGAPCVVGNLWDVTDRDIDRYCLTLIEDFVKGQVDSLAKCVAEARRACKLRYIVGSAPICYGVPLKCSSR